METLTFTAKEIIDAFCLETTINPSNKKVFPNTYKDGYEGDVFEVSASGYLYEYEVKISRSDFKAEKRKLSKEQHLIGGGRCNRFYYLVPEGLISVDEIPQFAGLIYITNCWHEPTRKMGNYDAPNWLEPRIKMQIVKPAPKLSAGKIGNMYMSKLLESTYRRFHQNIRNQYEKGNVTMNLKINNHENT